MGIRQENRIAAALTALLLLALYLSASFVLPGRVDVRRYSSGVLDMDVQRVVADVASTRPAYRASVHPLQKLLVSPIGRFLNRQLFGGRNRLAAVKILIAVAMAANAIACAWLARQLSRGSNGAALAAGLVCGASFSSILAASIPESASFSCLTSVLPLLLLGARWKRPFGWGEACAWGALAVPGLGLTLSQIAHWAIALVVRLHISPGTRVPEPRGRRAAQVALLLALGALGVFAAVKLQSHLYPGTPEFWAARPLESERPHLRVDALRDAPLRHAARLAGHFLALDFAAPFPGHSDFLIRSGSPYWSLSIEEARLSDWAPAQRALGALVLFAALASGALALRPDRRFLAPLLCVASQFALHLVYGREYVLYSPHWHGVLVAVLVAGAWNGLGRGRRWIPGAAALLAALLLANNLVVMGALYREVAAGLDVSVRDAEGKLRAGRFRPRPSAPGRLPPPNSRPPAAAGDTP